MFCSYVQESRGVIYCLSSSSSKAKVVAVVVVVVLVDVLNCSKCVVCGAKEALYPINFISNNSEVLLLLLLCCWSFIMFNEHHYYHCSQLDCKKVSERRLLTFVSLFWVTMNGSNGLIARNWVELNWTKENVWV